MKRIWTVCLIALLWSGSASLLQAQTGTEKSVAALEQHWLQSQKTNNPELVAPLRAEKFINTGRDGKITDRTASRFVASLARHKSLISHT
jgi:hypothetical protein